MGKDVYRPFPTTNCALRHNVCDEKVQLCLTYYLDDKLLSTVIPDITHQDRNRDQREERVPKGPNFIIYKRHNKNVFVLVLLSSDISLKCCNEGWEGPGKPVL